ncbi:beta-agarase AgaA [Zobellia galactanivorans]|uniref:Beta-agarase A n=1 Tax=Zobellia galactanivorans (strain DSM 12802 / CCUG 47099 / CIP 106680 / NCIMB 13871 / Dsij) TaxID=63186 RepID=AGAA_ZOBGA|nr:beta-agarase AgaA [Zobellia galactanivorans]G0L322.1 RecName: Full=Beta-agarase A; Contains: RecName: Full=Beta-agarase A catalytic chain; Short=AgaAc; Flags: Precursor [Zobellia galactanivorans]CAZ98338.1 Beta-agarase A, family GH16 [Zobellia galactanivorans]
MKKNYLLLYFIFLLCGSIAAQDWNGIPVPANPGNGMTWQLQDNVSDSFNYTSSEGNRPTAFTSKWKPSYINGWTGPGSTIFNAPQAWTNGSQLAIQAQPAGNGKSYNGIITSKNKIQYPVYMEIKAKIMDQVLANAFWTLTDDETQEIDIMEGYGSDRGGTWFAQRMHLSHHTFIRNPFTDYQPMGDATWYYNGGTPWRSAYHRYGCYWKDPFTLEYYIDGVKVRTVTRAEIDPNNHLGGTGLNQATNIIIDCENQTDWRPAATQEELADDSKNIFWVDWIRVYKPVAVSGGGNNGNDGATEFQYDLGTDTSAVWPGYTRVSNTTRAGNFGWANTNDIGSRDRGASNGRNNINRDINFSSQTRFFTQDLSNGTYNVLITFGDTYARKNMNVAAEGQNKLTNINTNAGQYVSRSFDVNVNDGKLDLRFSVGNGGDVWSITRIWIRKVTSNSANLLAAKGLTLEDPVETTEFLYPNPAKTDDFVTVPNSEIGSSIIIYNSAGQVVKKVSVVSENQKISLEGFAKGMYFINLNGQSTKLIVQ